MSKIIKKTYIILQIDSSNAKSFIITCIFFSQKIKKHVYFIYLDIIQYFDK